MQLCKRTRKNLVALEATTTPSIITLLTLQLFMNKATLFGFCGFVNILESIFEMFQKMGKLGLLPTQVDAAKPLA